jgi:hypothetical protein
MMVRFRHFGKPFQTNLDMGRSKNEKDPKTDITVVEMLRDLMAFAETLISDLNFGS